MKIFNITAIGLAYVCAGASFAANQPKLGLIWILVGIGNHFISLTW